MDKIPPRKKIKFKVSRLTKPWALKGAESAIRALWGEKANEYDIELEINKIMPSIKIKEYTYKGFKIQIDFAEGKDWGVSKDKFYCNSYLPKSVGCFKEIDKLQQAIKEAIDEWCAIQPKTNEEWVELVTSCVIQTGYEDWHVDEQRIMNVLERYAAFKKVL